MLDYIPFSYIFKTSNEKPKQKATKVVTSTCTMSEGPGQGAWSCADVLPDQKTKMQSQGKTHLQSWRRSALKGAAQAVALGCWGSGLGTGDGIRCRGKGHY